MDSVSKTSLYLEQFTVIGSDERWPRFSKERLPPAPKWFGSYDTDLALRSLGIDRRPGECSLHNDPGPEESPLNPKVTSCASLLQDPIRVLRDQSLWPDHICWHIALESRRSRARKRIDRSWPTPNREQAQAIAEWAKAWSDGIEPTIGVGRRSISHTMLGFSLLKAASGADLDEPLPEPTLLEVERLAPFDGWEQAFLIAPVTLDEDSGDLYFLMDKMDRHGEYLFDESWMAGLSVKPMIPGAFGQQYEELVKAASRWWKRIDLARVPPHPGGRGRARPPYSALWRAWQKASRADNKMAALSRELAADGFSISERKLYDIKRELTQQGKWPPKPPRNANIRTLNKQK